MDPRTTIPELFAIVRQWVPQVQHKIDVIGNEVRTRINNAVLQLEFTPLAESQTQFTKNTKPSSTNRLLYNRLEPGLSPLWAAEL